MNYCNNPANFCSSLNSYSFLTRQTKDVNLVKLTRWEFVVWGKYPWPICSVPLLLWDTYTRVHNVSSGWPVYVCSKMLTFQRVGMREGRLSLPPALQYLILMIWRACNLNLVMISLLASKWQEFKLRGLQFHFIKQLKNGHSNFKDLLFWSQWRYHDQI